MTWELITAMSTEAPLLFGISIDSLTIIANLFYKMSVVLTLLSIPEPLAQAYCINRDRVIYTALSLD